MATIRKLSSGRWQAVIRKKGHAESRTFSLKATAEKWARDIESKLDRDEHNTPISDTVGDTLTWYLERFTDGKKSATKEKSRIRILDNELGELTLSALTVDEVVEYAESRLESVTSDTVRKELNTLSVVIDAAIALKGYRIPNRVKQARAVLTTTKALKPGIQRDRRPTPDELKRLSETPHWPLWEFAIETAMRRGELSAQRREHKDGAILRIPETKTKPRTIPLSDRACAILDKLPTQINGTAWGMTPDAITRAFARDCETANVSGLRFHDLRHEGTSRLFELGLSIPEVAAITGHDDWSSLKRYTQLCPIKLATKLTPLRSRGTRPGRVRK